jgi:WD40 repeat protein/energy-coupling factor transporter ATP-binding protein EcfA2
LLPGVEEPFDANRLPHFLRARTWVDFRRGHDDARALQDLANAVRGVPFGPPASASGAHVDDVAPYRGLRAFGEEDARLFFGRDREIQRLLEKLKSSRFVAVLGPSGSGKSSIVRAGLVPRLRAGTLVGGGRWPVCVLRPGAAPLTALAVQLANLRAGGAMQATLDGLEQDPRTLHLSVELVLAERPPGEHVVVVVDQLEEVFTLCRDESQRHQLFANLLYASSAAGGRTIVVVTLRADFYPRCADYPEFAQLLAAQQMLVGPMDADGVRQAIQEPARRVGLTLEDGLSDTILSDVAAEPGALPLLQHALLEVWEHRDGKTLTLRGYRRAGGVHGALAQRADEIYDEFSVDQQQIARRMLLRLTQPGEGTEDTRRRAPRGELAPAGAGNDFDEVLGRLVDARLLTTGRDETGAEIVDVAHEALVRGWPRLRGWINAARQDLVVHRRLTDAVAEWARLKDDGALYRGVRLGEAQALRERDPDALNDAERAFLDASVERDESVRRKELDDARELAGAQRRVKRRLALVALILLTGVVATSSLTVIALHARNVAQRKADEAMSLALVSTASPRLAARPDISLLLAFEAYHASPRPEARDAVLSALVTARKPHTLAILHGHTDGAVTSLAFRPDGRTLASAGADGTVQVWDARTHRQLGKPLTGHTDAVRSLAFSRDGRMLASAGADGTVRLWDARTHRQLGKPLTGPTDTVYDVAFSHDGRTLASVEDTAVRLWDAHTHRQLGEPLRGETQPIVQVAFSPDGRTLASAGVDNMVRLWDVRARRQLGKALRGHTGAVSSVAFSHDGRTLASAGDDRTVRLWDVRARRQLGKPLEGHTSTVTGVAFSRDGRTLASASADGTVRLWDPRTRGELGRSLGRPRSIYGVAFSPDGRTLASAGYDGTVRLWDARTHRRLGKLTGLTSTVTGMVFSPDGRTLASAGYDRTVRLWDARTHRQLGKPLSAPISTAGGGLVPLIWRARTLGGVVFSRDGRTLASAGADGMVRLWDVRARRQLGKPLEGHTSTVTGVAFSPDGRTLASAGEDGVVRLWDPRSHRQLGKLTGHTRPVFGVAFSPDGRTLASAGYDRTLRLWDPRIHQSLGKPLTGHTGPVLGVSFSADGRTLISADAGGAVKSWDGLLWRDFGELRREVCRLVGGGLSRSEWREIVVGISYRDSCPRP